ncbi:hypothetical protein [Azospirillum sp. NL1]|uniref:hypothetical protein n=1 Tax=Azospirillum sp. NL1 TaxID=3082952 RepID=UPI00298978D6|nr:hypothetical protein [Azospirillum sp. NL1]MDW5538117.1 hypothetical protein [Azospirillum sp. NL1]
MAEYDQPPLSHPLPPEPPRAGFARGLSGAAVLAALALACAAAPLMADGSAVHRLDADPVAAALLDGRGSLSFALLAAVLGGGLASVGRCWPGCSALWPAAGRSGGPSPPPIGWPAGRSPCWFRSPADWWGRSGCWRWSPR